MQTVNNTDCQKMKSFCCILSRGWWLELALVHQSRTISPLRLPTLRIHGEDWYRFSAPLPLVQLMLLTCWPAPGADQILWFYFKLVRKFLSFLFSVLTVRGARYWQFEIFLNVWEGSEGLGVELYSLVSCSQRYFHPLCWTDFPKKECFHRQFFLP